MAINDRVKAAVVSAVKKMSQPKKLSDRLNSLLDSLADSDPDVDPDALASRVDDIIEAVEIRKSLDEGES